MSQPPDYPGTPADPQRGNQTPPGYPPPPGYGAPPPPPPAGPGNGAPPPGPGSRPACQPTARPRRRSARRPCGYGPAAGRRPAARPTARRHHRPGAYRPPGHRRAPGRLPAAAGLRPPARAVPRPLAVQHRRGGELGVEQVHPERRSAHRSPADLPRGDRSSRRCCRSPARGPGPEHEHHLHRRVRQSRVGHSHHLRRRLLRRHGHRLHPVVHRGDLHGRRSSHRRP